MTTNWLAQIWVKLFNFYSVIRNYYYFSEQLSLLVSQQRLYFVLRFQCWLVQRSERQSVLFLFNNYSISQDKGVGIIQEALCEIENKGFCIKSNELSINSISKQLLYWCWTPFLKGRYPQHSNSIVFSFRLKGSFWLIWVAPLAQNHRIPFFIGKNIITIYRTVRDSK
jgi:hypothetical protein